MTRFLATARLDVQLQFRNGFYYAMLFVVLFWLVLLSQIPAFDAGWLLPALIAGNLLLTTFYFVGGLVLLEKAEGTLEAQVVTPLRTRDDLASEVATLTLLSLIENVTIALLLYGPRFAPLPLVAGIALATALFVLVGFVAVARYDSINEYLLPSVLYSGIASAPIFAYLGQWDAWPIYLHPLQGALVVMEAAFRPVEAPRLLFGLLSSAVWIALVCVASQRTFARFVTARAGVH